MEPTQAAEFISRTFYGFDMEILQWVHKIALQAGAWLKIPMTAVTYTGNGGIFLIIVSLCLIGWRRTRKQGLCAIVALAVGAVFTNILLKNIIDRVRPYEMHQVLRQMWTVMGSLTERDGSFPSGHMTACCAFSTAIMITGGKRTLWLIAYEIAMGFSRLYFVVHYPSDILGGFIVGTAAGIIGARLGVMLYKSLCNRRGGSGIEI